MFERDFMLAFNKYMNQKKEQATKPYAEGRDWQQYRLQPSYKEVHPFTVEGDDSKYHNAKWNSLLKDSAFYYDVPSIEDEREMRFKLQLRYDDLFESAWRPPLQSRRDLVQWACEEKNKYLEAKGASEKLMEDCSNYSQLLRKFGPDYSSLKAKLGYVKGLFEDTD